MRAKRAAFAEKNGITLEELLAREAEKNAHIKTGKRKSALH